MAGTESVVSLFSHAHAPSHHDQEMVQGGRCGVWWHWNHGHVAVLCLLSLVRVCSFTTAHLAYVSLDGLAAWSPTKQRQGGWEGIDAHFPCRVERLFGRSEEAIPDVCAVLLGLCHVMLLEAIMQYNSERAENME